MSLPCQQLCPWKRHSCRDEWRRWPCFFFVFFFQRTGGGCWAWSQHGARRTDPLLLLSMGLKGSGVEQRMYLSTDQRLIQKSLISARTRQSMLVFSINNAVCDVSVQVLGAPACTVHPHALSRAREGVRKRGPLKHLPQCAAFSRTHEEDRGQTHTHRDVYV